MEERGGGGGGGWREVRFHLLGEHPLKDIIQGVEGESKGWVGGGEGFINQVNSHLSNVC